MATKAGIQCPQIRGVPKLSSRGSLGTESQSSVALLPLTPPWLKGFPQYCPQSGIAATVTDKFRGTGQEDPEPDSEELN
ncbi:hypothetical protein DO97_02480 [Neosynechococcus sphagnicola sy1]|uniref:Uncharacterized protein n=1 Tax=Neosynechococcus sphagnicola sy1 TaxID=1497020 RepID=A0A098TKW0_9CYAN|nr:hypothetical protein DO97_02480 [Neosynechococcus sphagnicola sy1]